MLSVEERGSVFQLADLDLEVDQFSPAKGLPAVNPDFSLPLLRDEDSIQDRLLGSLRYRTPGVPRSESIRTDGLSDSPNSGSSVEEVSKVSRQFSPHPLEWADLVEAVHGEQQPKAFPAVNGWDDVLQPAGSVAEVDHRHGQAMFESVLLVEDESLSVSTLAAGQGPAPPITSQALLSSMSEAVLGVAGGQNIVWDAKASRYALQARLRVDKVDNATARSAVRDFLDIATCVRRLETVIEDQSRMPLTSTHHAMLHHAGTVLTHEKQRLAETVSQSSHSVPRGWAETALDLRPAKDQLVMLCDLLGWPLSAKRPAEVPPRASSVLNIVYGLLDAHLAVQSPVDSPSEIAVSLAYILAHSSGPLSTLLQQWVGLLDSDHIDHNDDPEVQPWADLGITRRSRRRADGSRVSWEYDVSSRKMPSFVPREQRRPIFEMGRSLRLLREASGGQHPLCSGGWGVDVAWGWDSDSPSKAYVRARSATLTSRDHADSTVRNHVRQVQKEIQRWKILGGRSDDGSPGVSGSASILHLRSSRATASPRAPRLGRQMPSNGEESPADRAPADADLEALWARCGGEPGSHLGVKDTPLWTAHPLDAYQALLRHHVQNRHPLLPLDSLSLEAYSATHVLAPLVAHGQLVSTELVRWYLDDLLFLDHLDVLRAFWLAGDAGFTDRVSAALFGREEAGAGEALGLGRRARTRARLGLKLGQVGRGGEETETSPPAPEGEWGIGLGVGLSDRAKWPPGGAELAYALRTTILDAPPRTKRGPVWEAIEDRVSFAIRPLPEEEGRDGRRAKWLNPQSIEALDFLYLAYSPPPAMTVLLPQAVMDKYQRIHGFLLRLARVDRVISTTFVDLSHFAIHGDDGAYRTALALRFRMSAFVAALQRYVLDTAIGVNWEIMRRRLRRLKDASAFSPRSGGTTFSRASRPGTPGSEREHVDSEADNEHLTADDFDDMAVDAQDGGEDEDDGDGPDNEMASALEVRQLRSVHSLVAYHGITLDRVLRSCLLQPDHPGQQLAYKILLALFGLVLDFSKIIKEMDRQSVSSEKGSMRIRQISKEWGEKDKVFSHALERLALRTTPSSGATGVDGNAGDDPVDEAARDLQMLLRGEAAMDEDEAAGRSPAHANGATSQLQELVLRLKLGGDAEFRTGQRL